MAYSNAQFILLGTGERYYETQMWQLASRYSGRMSVYLLHNDILARRIYAGSDAFLMPSRFEPCGISQMLAMRYGCVPIVRRTGGLVDTVEHHIPMENRGTGYCFDRYEPLDLYTCLVRAWEGFHYKDKWQGLQQRGMAKDFSWDRSAEQYINLYRDLLGPEADEPASVHQVTPEAQSQETKKPELVS
jgi:starch synthase